MDTCTGQWPKHTAHTHTQMKRQNRITHTGTRAHAHWRKLTTTGSLSFLIKLINARTCELPTAAAAAGRPVGQPIIPTHTRTHTILAKGSCDKTPPVTRTTNSQLAATTLTMPATTTTTRNNQQPTTNNDENDKQ